MLYQLTMYLNGDPLPTLFLVDIKVLGTANEVVSNIFRGSVNRHGSDHAIRWREICITQGGQCSGGTCVFSQRVGVASEI